ncbi:MAG TPA: cupin domain-containing protein [Opitutaceae bacterium]|nr:cupin domain-containing protein [Opitutaceae bacterium]
MAHSDDVLAFLLKDGGAIPNNPALPVLVYKKIGQGQTDEARARWFETTWQQHGWAAAWRWGVYDFPHYHSTAHEILGVFRGRASLRIGHESGITVTVETGDMLVLPAGTGHQNLGSSGDFQVAGGYPKGQQADLLRGEAGERPQADERIRHVPLPSADPLHGPEGPLVTHWLKAE